MRLVNLKLTNYLAIYNGLGINEINLDLSNNFKLITLIKGATGTGKSTIQSAISLLPEGNINFIHGLTSSKELVFVTNDNLVYRIFFLHEFKNGKRATVKCYIHKTFEDGFSEELNPNGNLGSYKDIIESEFDIDLGFLMFSKISNEEKGIVDKTPAKRKEFFNLLLSSTEVYNEIFKRVNKIYTQKKALRNSIITKLENLGTRQNLINELTILSNEITGLKESKSLISEEIGEIKATIKGLDPNGLIQQKYMELDRELKDLNQKMVNTDFTSLDESLTLEELYERLNNDNNNHTTIEKDIIKITATRDSLVNQLSNLTNELDDLMSKKFSSNSIDVDSLINRKNQLMTYKDNNISIMNKLGLDLYNTLDSESYLKCIHVIIEISESINNLNSTFDQSSIDKAINIVTKNITFSNVDIEREIERLNIEKRKLEDKIQEIKFKENIITSLSYRPSECKVDKCHFIMDAIKYSKDEDVINKEEYINNLEIISNEIELNRNLINENKNIQDIANILSDILRTLDVYKTTFKKIKIIDEIFLNGILLIENIKVYDFNNTVRILNSNAMESSIISEFNNNIEELNIINNQLAEIEGIGDVANINSNIEKIKTKIENINNEINSMNSEINGFTLALEKANVAINDTNNLIELLKIKLTNNENMNHLKEEYYKIKDDMGKINSLQSNISSNIEKLNSLDIIINPKELYLSKLNSNIDMINQYEVELVKYNQDFMICENIKKYTNPSGIGIQTIFMSYYLHGILNKANTLLRYFFQGEFELLKSTDSLSNELNIPIKGNGLIHEDISSLSFSQRCIISMILSISLYTKVSQKYRIVLLDEIDCGLDTVQRSIFTGSLYNIAAHCELDQIILTSHNIEINEDDCDIIDLNTFKIF